MQLSSKYFGLTDYDQALNLQKWFVEQARETSNSFLLGFEHPAVVTLGVRGTPQDFKVSKATLQEKQVTVAHIDRGGETTLHSPGQLVVYPILPLKALGLGVREFVEKLELAAISFFKHYGVACTRGVGEPGIYSVAGKIAFIGIRVERGVTYHGISLNIQNDLSLFQLIRSCGKDVERFDQLKNYDVNASQMECFEIFVRLFQEQFAGVVATPLTEPVSQSNFV